MRSNIHVVAGVEVMLTVPAGWLVATCAIIKSPAFGVTGKVTKKLLLAAPAAEVTKLICATAGAAMTKPAASTMRGKNHPLCLRRLMN